MSFYYNPHQQHPTPAAAPVGASHHGGRNRRQPRVSVSQNSHRQLRHGRNGLKEMQSNLHLNEFRLRFEACRSFDLEDDFTFCPTLLTENDMVSIHSNSSERSSLASNSPEHSPSQPVQLAPAFSLNSSSPPFVPPAMPVQHSSLKLHQPAATRARNAIPIVNPATGISMSSPPPSVSPARMQHSVIGRRW